MPEGTRVGFVTHGNPEVGAFVSINHPKLRFEDWVIKNGSGTAMFHESCHIKWAANGNGKSREAAFFTAVVDSGMSAADANKAFNRAALEYGYTYAEQEGVEQQLGVSSYEEWKKLSDDDRLSKIDAIKGGKRETVKERLYEELTAFFATRDPRFAELKSFNKMCESMRSVFDELGIYKEADLRKMANKAHTADLASLHLKQSLPNMKNSSQSQNNELEGLGDFGLAPTSSQAQSPGRTPGTHEPIRSAVSEDLMIRGEKATQQEYADAVAQDMDVNDDTYISRTNEARSHTADVRTETQAKADQEYRRLMDKETVWNDDDIVTAEKLMFNMIKGIRDYQLSRYGRVSKAQYLNMVENHNAMLQKYNEVKSHMGQGLQARYMFSEDEQIIIRAAKSFLSGSLDGRFAGANPMSRMAKLYGITEELATKTAEAKKAGDVQALAKIVKDVGYIRNRQKMFGPLSRKMGKIFDARIDAIASRPDAVETLSMLAFANTNLIIDDCKAVSVSEAVRSIRIMNMLSNTATIINNVANNWVRGEEGKLAQNLGVMAAKPFEELTGKHVLSKTKYHNKGIASAEAAAFELGFLLQYSGIQMNNGKYELNNTAQFNPNAGFAQGVMAHYKFLTGMGVEVTDQVKSAGLREAMRQGMEEDVKAGKISEQERTVMEREAEHETNVLLFKDDNALTNWIQHTRDLFNKVHIGDFGAGDFIMAFAKVPTNVGRAKLMSTQYGAMYQVCKYFATVQQAKTQHAQVRAAQIANDANLTETQKWQAAKTECSGKVYNQLQQMRQAYAGSISYEQCVDRAGLKDAKEMSTFKMAQASRGIGKAATTAGMILLGAALQGLGALKDLDLEQDDETRKLMKQRGFSGLMLNLSAIGRPGRKWDLDHDHVLDMKFLEIIALPLSIGATFAEEMENGENFFKAFFKDAPLAGLQHCLEAIEELPGLQEAANLYKSIVNQSYGGDDAEAKYNRVADTLTQYLANSLPSFFIPNVFSQAAAGLDNTQRDIYTADNRWERAWNIVKGKGGVLIRGTLPAATDMFGQTRTYGENRAMGFLNKVVLPGDVKLFQFSKTEQELMRLNAAGYGNCLPDSTVSGSFEAGGNTFQRDAEQKIWFKGERAELQSANIEEFLQSDLYQSLSDAQRADIIRSLKTDATHTVNNTFLDIIGESTRVNMPKWETELGTNEEKFTYLAAKYRGEELWNDEDKSITNFGEMDAYLKGTYKGLSDTQRDILDGTVSRLDDLYDASQHGINSEMWQKGYDIYRQYTSQEGKDAVDGGYKGWEVAEMMTRIQKATGASEKQMDWFENNMKLWGSYQVTSEHYDSMVDTGISRERATGLVKDMANLQPVEGNENVSYKQRLTAIAKADYLSENDKWTAFFEYCPKSYTKVIQNMANARAKGNSYYQALNYCGKWME